MTRTCRKWMIAALTFGALIAGPAAAAHAADAPPAALTLGHDTILQPNYYYCGPAAVRNAMTAHGVNANLHQLARELGTTTSGTDSSYDITRVLNAWTSKDRYRTVEIPGQRATRPQIERLQADIVRTINRGDAIVANVAGTVRDTNGDVHSYPGGHYIAIVGYDEEGRVAKIADSADWVGSPEYEVRADILAHWIATRGYSA